MENNDLEEQKCPQHDKAGKFIPPTETDNVKKKLIVTFQCPEGHTFIKEFDLK